MAASSSSPSSGGHCKYDVFLSFRGEDTRKNFVCHLYRALEQKAIHTFIDSEELEKGNKISELLNFIDESRIAVVVLSQNYATSTWCLKELVKIMECKDKKQQIVVPIFYEVDPSDIRKLEKMFGEAFAKHEQNPYLDKEVLETWKTALKGITDLSGWDSRHYKDDIELIEKIVGDMLEKWIHIPRSSSPANNLVGMDHHIKEVSLRLCRGKNDVGVVGIWGMGGIGKTTIARAVYEKIVHQFEHKCFFSNVKERFAKKDEAQMRGELLSMILKGNVQSVDIFNEGSNAILERLGKKKVLVVLDDVETFSQIEALLGDFYSFGVGSRILVTTRDKESLAAAGVYETYEPRCLNHNESLELFMKHAFRTNQPSKEYSDLSNRAIEYAQGLPLALKVLGASLYDKSIHQWKELLEKIKKIPERKIMDVLRTSFEGLDDLQKEIFLDIACLFRGWNKDFVTELLKSFGFFPQIGLKNLDDKALITSDYDVSMHDLLQEMGREIVRQESTKEPGKRSRLWSCEDVYDVLTQNTATDAVECLMLDLSKSKVDLCIHTGAFARMTKLRLLIIYYSFTFIFDVQYYYRWGRSNETICPVDGCKQLTRGDFEFLSHELRFLLWHGCPLKSLPSTFIPKNLVHLDMRSSHIRELWEGIKPLQNLKVIKLSHCQYLVKIPDLTEAINLERLFLDDCSSLFEVHSSISALQNLHLLGLKGCKQLKILPSCIHMKSLRTLCLSGCSNLEKFPEISEVMTKLEELDLDGTAIKELPSSINNLTGLGTLNLRGCTELKILPSCFHMKSLQSLYLSGCSNLEKFPEISEVMTKLEELDLDGTAIKELPSSINNLTGLGTLNLRGCTELKILPSCFHMKSLQSLYLSGCSNLEKFPEISEVMTKLEELDLDGTAIKELPSSINNLTGLGTLNLRGCTELKILPSCFHMKSLQSLYLSGCSNLEKFPEIADVMTELKWLYLDGTAIKELPSSINNLTGLETLNLEGCTELKTLSTRIHMSSVRRLNLNGCSSLENFPESSGIMKELPELRLDGTAIKGLPSSIDLLRGIKELSMKNCKSLVFLPDSINNLADLTHCTELKTLATSIHMSSLRTLNLEGCSNLEKFPEISGIMKKLPELRLDGTAIKGLPSSINLLLRVKKLSMRNCKSLECLPDSICNLANLTHLDLSGCSVLHNLPEKLGGLESLQVLDIEYSGIKQLPFSILRLGKLRGNGLSCIGCKEMTAPLLAWPSSIEEYCSFSVLLHLDLSDCNLLELSDGIAHLSSLKTLKLCRNNLESLPVTMNRLVCLALLELEACKRLKSIPELSSSINYIDAHDCTALEKVSMPKPESEYWTNHYFTFSNCLQLVQTNLFRDIVERNSHLQDNYLPPLRLKMSLPGSEVPNWFPNQSGGFSVSVQLPLNLSDCKFLGFAICAVCKCQGINDDTSPLSASCLCTFKGNRGECSFSFDLLNSVFRTDRLFSSDHMFLRYVSWSDCRLIEEGKLVNEAYTEATFQIVVSESITEQLRIRSCGVRFVYANPDEMLDLNMPQPQVHADSCETGVCFMDPYELRNNETERVEISREIESSSNGLRLFHGNYMEVQNESMTQPTIHVEGLGAPILPDQLKIRTNETECVAESSDSGEGRGTYRTLELLPEPQTEREEEEEIMVVAAHGEGCWVLGPVCCCFSLSGCTMSFRNRNRKRRRQSV
ncbi:disease resistance protein RPV1 [Rosa sericea]